MGREYAAKWAKRHPKGAANSMHYTLLDREGRDDKNFHEEARRGTKLAFEGRGHILGLS